MPSVGAELLEEDNELDDEGSLEDDIELDDDGSLDEAGALDEVVDELFAILVDDLLPPPPSPPHATRPRMLSVSRLSFSGWLTGFGLLLDIVIAVSLIFI